MKYFLVILYLGVIFGGVTYHLMAEEDVMIIEKGREVSFDYVLTVDGEVVDSSKDSGPLKYIHGSGQIIPGLSKQLKGLQTGDERVIEVVPDEAYGSVNQQEFYEVPKASLPAGINLEVGMPLHIQGPEGRVTPVKIAEIKEDTIVLDLNHPLAGKVLTFKVKIVSVQ